MSTRVTDGRVDRLGRELEELLGESTGGLGLGARACTRYRNDPVGFDRWAGRDPVDYQQDIMRAVLAQRYVTVAGGNGVGKDFLLASLAIWAAFARKMLVIVVSATEKQSLGQSMMEVYACWRAHAAAGHRLAGQFFRGSLRVGGVDRIVALTGGSSVDALGGWHDEAGVLVLISEAQGEALEKSVYETLDAITTNENSRVLVQGNPTRPHGPFFAVNQRKSWQRFSISVFDTPNVKAKKMVHAAFPAPDWPELMAQEHGIASPWSVARVLGRFPTSATDALVRLELLEEAAGEERAKEFEAEVALGPGNADWRGRTHAATHAVVSADIAREGADATAICVRRGPVLWELHRWRESDVIENARRITGVVRHLIADGVGVSHCVIDETSMGGGVFDQLVRELRDVSWMEPRAAVGLTPPSLVTMQPQLVGFKSSRRAPMPERFVDTRAQSFWHVRDEYERGRVAYRRGLDAVLLGELREELAAHSYHYEGDDRIRVNPKDEVKSRLGRSPDLADALAMSYEPVLKKSGKRAVQWA